ncbi:MAG: Ubiquinone biosynthesis O-methyltransferase [Pseudomonadales bacterium]|nr:Ubiquinone biosynthesis O-methyltransferase [Pseudomonadales bacterium]
METVDLDFVPIGRGERVLDLGCGEGRHAIAAWLKTRAHCVGVDLSLRDVGAAAAKADGFRSTLPADPDRSVGFGCADALALPFADHCFDVVICSEVLEHIGPYRAVLAEIRRVLKPGGLLVASVPRYWPERVCWALSDAYHANEGGHIRIFRACELKRDIETLGFRRYHRHFAHALHVPFWWLKCLLWERQEQSRAIAWYHRLLVWDLMERPWPTRWLERLLNPVMGKSVVMYFEKARSG